VLALLLPIVIGRLKRAAEGPVEKAAA
jgi:hypothetical protein